MKALLLLTLILLASCGIKQEQDKEYRIDPAFSAQVNNFYNIHANNSDLQRDDLVVEFDSSIQYPTLGVCQTQYSEKKGTLGFKKTIKRTPVIKISLEWNTMSEARRFALIDHELGHCLLNRGHRNDDLGNGQAASIMNEYILSDTAFKDNYKYYQEELHSVSIASTVAFTFSSQTGSFAVKDNGDKVEFQETHQHNGEVGVDDCVHSHKEKVIVNESN